VIALPRRLAAVLAALPVCLIAAAPAAADLPSRDAIVPSYDGAPLIVTLHPAAGLQAGQHAPTILQTHGWAGSRQKNPDAASDETTGNVGVGPLRRAGFNVLTWDSRGFGDSGGVVQVDGPDSEGRDVQVLLDWVAQQPEALLDGPGDPRAGMEGVSYAGGIELVAAGLDNRIDAIAPTIAWHSLLTSLYPEELIKGGWASALVAAGIPAADTDGLDSPAGPQTGGLDPHIYSAFQSGTSTGPPTTAAGSPRAAPATWSRGSPCRRCSSRAPPTRCSRSTRRSPTSRSCAPTRSRRSWSGSAAVTGSASPARARPATSRRT
jgi:pimeloyl-ACP methyl ester carboxylesterase